MNKRLKKKSEKMRREALHRILDLVLDINGMQESQQEVTGNHPTSFMGISGHIAVLEVDIHNNGWMPNADASERYRCYFDDHKFGDTPAQMAEKLGKLKEELEYGRI